MPTSEAMLRARRGLGECAGDEQPEALRGYDKQHCGEGYRGHGPVHGEVHEAEQDGVDSEGYGAEHCRLRDEFAGESSVDIARAVAIQSVEVPRFISMVMVKIVISMIMSARAANENEGVR